MKPPRRYHHLPFKLQIVQECSAPGATIAGAAQQHGLNANLVHKWIVALQRRPQANSTPVPTPVATPTPAPKPSFVPVPLEPPRPDQPLASIRIEVPHARGTVVINVPVEHASTCTTLLAEVLK